MHKILVIDDEESTRELLKLTLESDGYEVCAGEDGCSGINEFERFQPEIVLTDIKMPGMDGIEVLRRLKQLNPDVEVIVITGHGEMELAIKALQLEASDFINKPISDQALTVALRRAKEKIWMRNRLKDYTTNLECMLKDAIEEVKKRHDFEHQLLHTSMDGIIANDLNGNIIIFNEGASRIYGYSREEALCTIDVTRLYPEGEARAIKKKIYGRDYGGPGRLINYETRALTREGRLVPILLSATLVYEDDREIATVGYFKDLTQIKQLQQELVQRTRMAAIGQAMAEIAHGVKNILYGMKLGAFMVNKALGRGDLEGISRGWQLVQKNMERISHFSLDMLSYARRGGINLARVSINEVAKEVCEALAGRAASRRVCVDKDLTSDLPEIMGDGEALHTCLMNLVTNAIEAVPENRGEGRVLVRTRRTADDRICVEVIDNGKGISPELQKEVFKPLFSTKRARGTGLGLSITEKIIHEHGGFIDLRSSLNEGSAFVVQLPISGPKGDSQELPRFE